VNAPGASAAAILATLDEPLRAAFASAEALVLDVDGVLTDGRIHCGPGGAERLTFHVRDSSGVWQAHKSGIRVGIVTGRATGIPETRPDLFPFTAVRTGMLDKAAGLRSLLAEIGVPPERCVYMGDDVLDAPAMRIAALPVCVADAESDLVPYARYVTRRRGGRGAVREVTDLMLEARGVRAPMLASLFGIGSPRP
jgi:3-deoxy-D-manno-octulosonate 8-phosphate phosphatase (KDO 8-P phosphatase)